MNIDSYTQRMEFINLIIKNLSLHPDWLRDVLDAVFLGMKRNQEAMAIKLSNTHRAFLCALNLADKKRISPKTKEWLNDLILENIKSRNSHCETEKEFLKANDKGDA